MLRKMCLRFYFLIFKGLSNDDVRVARGTVFQEIRPGAGFKTADFAKEKLGGATVEPHSYNIPVVTIKYYVSQTRTDLPGVGVSAINTTIVRARKHFR